MAVGVALRASYSTADTAASSLSCAAQNFSANDTLVLVVATDIAEQATPVTSITDDSGGLITWVKKGEVVDQTNGLSISVFLGRISSFLSSKTITANFAALCKAYIRLYVIGSSTATSAGDWDALVYTTKIGDNPSGSYFDLTGGTTDGTTDLVFGATATLGANPTFDASVGIAGGVPANEYDGSNNSTFGVCVAERSLVVRAGTSTRTANITGGHHCVGIVFALTQNHKYWVNNADANWDGTAGTRWALISGGVGGAAIPGANDNVFFDALSPAVTVTINAAISCHALDTTGWTGTLACSATGRIITIGGAATYTAPGWLTIGSGTNFGANIPASLTITVDNRPTTTESVTKQSGANAGTLLCGTANAAAVGRRVSGTGIPNGTMITGYVANTSYTISKNATSTGTITLTEYLPFVVSDSRAVLTSFATTIQITGSSTATLTFATDFKAYNLTASATAHGLRVNPSTTLTVEFSITITSTGSHIFDYSGATVHCKSFSNSGTSSAYGQFSDSSSQMICDQESTWGIQGVAWHGLLKVTVQNVLSFNNGTDTYENLHIVAGGFNRGEGIELAGLFIVSGTLTLEGASQTMPLIVRSATVMSMTISASGTVTLSNVWFERINGGNSGGWLTGTNIGNCGYNTGITFTAQQTLYWINANTSTPQDMWVAANWSASSGGSPGTTIPYPQDHCIFDQAGNHIVDFSWSAIDVYAYLPQIDDRCAYIIGNYGHSGNTIQLKLCGDIICTAATQFLDFYPLSSGVVTNKTIAFNCPTAIWFNAAASQQYDFYNNPEFLADINFGTGGWLTFHSQAFMYSHRIKGNVFVDVGPWLAGNDGTVELIGVNPTWSTGVLSDHSHLTVDCNNPASGVAAVTLTNIIGGANYYLAELRVRDGVSCGLLGYNSSNVNIDTITLEGTASLQVSYTSIYRVQNFVATGQDAAHKFTLTYYAIANAFSIYNDGGVPWVLDYGQFAYSHLVGGVGYAGSHSDDLGNNTGWLFYSPPQTITLTGIAPDTRVGEIGFEVGGITLPGISPVTSVGAITIVNEKVLLIDESIIAETSLNIGLTQVHLLTITEAIQMLESTLISFAQIHVLSGIQSKHVIQSDNMLLLRIVNLSVSSILLEMFSDTLTFKDFAGFFKVWVDEDWNFCPVKVWNGDEWVQVPVKRWTGLGWTSV